jgi:hypothetical protein
MHVSKDSMWQGIWKILQNFLELNSPLVKILLEDITAIKIMVYVGNLHVDWGVFF